MSGQICNTQEEKMRFTDKMKSMLWFGKVEDSLDYLSNIYPKKYDKLLELITYIDKHRDEIIDYNRRKKIGKTIGSGKIEKTVDQLIGLRQKRKGMSWVERGSRSLARLRCVELNGGWDDFWKTRAGS